MSLTNASASYLTNASASNQTNSAAMSLTNASAMSLTNASASYLTNAFQTPENRKRSLPVNVELYGAQMEVRSLKRKILKLESTLSLLKIKRRIIEDDDTIEVNYDNQLSDEEWNEVRNLFQPNGDCYDDAIVID